MSEEFALDPRLAADTFVVGETPLSQVLLMNDARYPWLILVPWQCDVTEPFELREADQAQLWRGSMRLGEAMKATSLPTSSTLPHLVIRWRSCTSTTSRDFMLMMRGLVRCGVLATQSLIAMPPSGRS